MVSAARSTIGFQSAATIQVGRTASRSRCVCSRQKQAVTGTATVPSNTQISIERRQLTAYEDFLRGVSLRQLEGLTGGDVQTAYTSEDAPVFQTAEGGLVCQWDVAIASERRRSARARTALAEYEAFMATTQAAELNASTPVYLTDGGNLVCHYA